MLKFNPFTGTFDMVSDLSSYLPLSGGTLSGTLNSLSIIPTVDGASDLGSSSKYFANGYLKKIYLNSTASLDGSVAGAVSIVGKIATISNANLSLVPNGTGYTIIGDAGTTSHSFNTNDDLLVSGRLEVDGVAYFDGGIIASNFTQLSTSEPAINQIYCIGDSLTESGIYEAQLATSLGAGWAINNKGISGQNTTQMLARFNNDIINAADGQYVIIYAGINDVIQAVSAATIEANLQAMYTAAHNAGLKVIAVNITPFKTYSGWTSGGQTLLNTVNGWIASTATNIDYKIDAYSALVDPGVADTLLAANDSGDHLHLSTIGYQLLGTTIYNGVTWTYNRGYALNIANTPISLNQSLLTTSIVKFGGFNGNINLFDTTGATVGVITKNTGTLQYPFIHNYAGAGSDGKNTFIGKNAGNFTMGTGGGTSNLGSQNTAIGESSFQSNTTGYQNTANGVIALQSNTTGYHNTANGVSALQSNTTGHDNTANGVSALKNTTTGSNNIANGTSALQSNTTGHENTANGVNALKSNTTGYYNTASGVNALQSNTTGYQNIVNGSYALYSNTTGYQNIANGDSALYSNITGNSNVALGHQAGYYETGSNKLFIDNQARASEADGRVKALIYGVFDATVANQSIVINGKFACNAATPQAAAASGGAVATTGSALVSYGYTQSQADGIVTLLNNIRAALVANGIMS